MNNRQPRKASAQGFCLKRQIQLSGQVCYLCLPEARNKFARGGLQQSSLQMTSAHDSLRHSTAKCVPNGRRSRARFRAEEQAAAGVHDSSADPTRSGSNAVFPESQISDDELNDLVAYLKALRKTH